MARKNLKPEPLSDLVKIEILKAAYYNVPSMLVVTFCMSLTLAVISHHRFENTTWYWFAFACVVTLVRTISVINFNISKKNVSELAKSYDYWKDQYNFWLIANGVLWATIAVYFVLANDIFLAYTVTIMVSGLAGGAAAVTAPMRNAGRAYVSLLLLPASLAVINSNAVEHLVGYLGFVFWLAMQQALNTNYEILIRSFKLQFKNNDLVNDLKSLNDNLESQVQERTIALEHLALHDSLTGLLNRNGIHDWLQGSASSTCPSLSILFIDLDRFKPVNDVKGHEIADQLLFQAGKRISSALPESSQAARWGGDEFIVLSPCNGDRESIFKLGNTLIDALSQPYDICGETISVGASIGIATYPKHGQCINDVIQAASLAVAEVKRTARGSIMLYDPSFADSRKKRFFLASELKAAIAKKQIHIAYQPIVDAKTGKIAAMEALARWTHKDLGPIPPDQFIKLAEDFDMIGDLGRYVMESACCEAMNWQDKGLGRPKVAVNVSIKQLLIDGFCFRVLKILERTGLPPQRLVIEVTESLFDDDNIDLVLETTKALKALGIEIDIDDFGTGYSSLSRLSKFPVSAIKIDKCFITNAKTDGRVIIESAVMIAQRFGLKIVAEGIETLDQATLLSELGVDYFQGYYLGKPQVAPELEARLPHWLHTTPIVRRIRRKA